MLLSELLLVLVNVSEGGGTLQSGTQQEGLRGLSLWHWGAYKRTGGSVNSSEDVHSEDSK